MVSKFTRPIPRATLATFALLVAAPCANAEHATEIRDAAAKIDARPRILITPEQAAGLKENAESDGHRAHIAEATLRKAETMLELPPVTREVQGRRMLHISRTALDRFVTLSVAWKLSGHTRFADRAITELQAVSTFENWNPSHFLDVAEMSLAAAIAYDWHYDRLDDETPAAARQAIYEKALTPALSSDRHWWKLTTNNWNQVCHGGLLAGAIAVIDHHPDEALRIIESTVRNVPTAMASYSPYGAYPEGPGYWSYGTTYNVVLLDLLQQNLGNTFGLDEITGFSETGAFPMIMTAPTGIVFNFSDNRASRGIHPTVYWLASHYDRPEWMQTQDRIAAAYIADSANHPAPSWSQILATLLWRSPDHADAPTAGHSLPLHWFSHGEVPVSVHRESWDDPDATFIGVKAGSPSASHGQMDIGSFIMEADGVRWAHDLGMESHHPVESRGIRLWDQSQGGDRWRVFRNNNHSHSTLTIDGQLQHAAGQSPMARFSTDPAFPHSVVDMSPSYHGQADTAHHASRCFPAARCSCATTSPACAPAPKSVGRWSPKPVSARFANKPSSSIRMANPSPSKSTAKPNDSGNPPISPPRPTNGTPPTTASP